MCGLSISVYDNSDKYWCVKTSKPTSLALLFNTV